jgi:glutamine amidotransferase
MSELIFNTRHSLIDQSLEAKLGPNTTNGDGFGVGWFDRLDTPGLYKSTQPAWNDLNLHDLCDHTNSRLFIAHIRASTGTPVQYTNCHPFRHGQWMFVHNGQIRDFQRIRRQLLRELDDEHFQVLGGGTDSELMFALALQFGMNEEPAGGIARMVGFIEQVGRSAGIEHPIQMTLGYSNGGALYAVRYSTEGESRTLFHSIEIAALEAELEPERRAVLEQMGVGARAIVSEPLSDLPDFWEPIPESSFVTIEDGEVHIQSFAPLAP